MRMGQQMDDDTLIEAFVERPRRDERMERGAARETAVDHRWDVGAGPHGGGIVPPGEGTARPASAASPR